MKERSIQKNLHLVYDNNDILISLDRSKAFDRVDHWFLVTVLETARFEPEFCKWISMLYYNPQKVVQVNGKHSVFHN